MQGRTKQRAEWERLKSALRGARFEEAREAVRVIDWKAAIRLAIDNDDLEAATAVSMSVELLDYFGDFAEARERIQPLAEHVEPQLRRLQFDARFAPRSVDERRHVKSHVWVLFHRGMSYYRLHLYDEARDLFELAESTCVRWLQRGSEYSCNGTLARVYYGFGLIHREQHAYRPAQDYFLRSVELTWPEPITMAADPADQGQGHSRWTDLALSRAVALGLAYIHHDLGQPTLALPLLLMARTILARLGETLLSGFVDLIYFNTIRSAHGDDPDRLNEAIDGLRRCFKAFAERQHLLYEMRAAHSVALALTQRAHEQTFSHPALGSNDLDEAEQYYKIAEKRAIQFKDFKIQYLLLVCLSRIERKRGHYDKAEELATRALKKGGDGFPLIRIRALTARAEAAASLGRYESAIQDLLLCDREDADVFNPRLRAVALLRCAQVYAKTGQSREAAETFEKYLFIKGSVSNAQTKELELQVRSELTRAANGRDFVVRMVDDNLDPQVIEQDLHAFLAQWARQRSQSDREAAGKLGVSRQTLLNWSSGKKTTGELQSDKQLSPSEAIGTKGRGRKKPSGQA